MSEEEKPTAAFILSLIGGIFILLGGGMMTMKGWSTFSGITGWRNYGGMMGPGFGMMGNGYAWGFSGMFGVAGTIFGVIVIVSALMPYNNPIQHSIWGLEATATQGIAIFVLIGNTALNGTAVKVRAKNSGRMIFLKNPICTVHPYLA